MFCLSLCQIDQGEARNEKRPTQHFEVEDTHNGITYFGVNRSVHVCGLPTSSTSVDYHRLSYFGVNRSVHVCGLVISSTSVDYVFRPRLWITYFGVNRSEAGNVERPTQNVEVAAWPHNGITYFGVTETSTSVVYLFRYLSRLRPSHPRLRMYIVSDEI